MRLPTLGDSLPTIQLERKISDADAAAIAKHHPWLDATYHDPNLLISKSSTVLTPQDGVLFHLIKGQLDERMLAAARPSLLKVATKRVIGGFRGASSGGLEPALRRDGSVSNHMRVPFHQNLAEAKGGVIGFFDRTSREDYCRSTSFTRDHNKEYSELLPYFQAVNRLYKDYAPEKYAAQAVHVEATHKDWIIPETIASTGTVNYNYPTTAHTDSGDCRAGLGVITTCCSGTFYGGHLCFPEYRCAVQLGHGDVLLANVHALHGNLPLLGSPGKFERLSTILYAREKIADCGTLTEETERFEAQIAWGAKKKSAGA